MQKLWPCVHGRDRKTNEWTNERMYEQTNGQMEKRNYIPPYTLYVGGIIRWMDILFIDAQP